MTTVFFPPSGASVDNPSLDLLRDWILAGSAAEWSAGSGDAGLSFQEQDFVAKLLLIHSEPHGFFIRYDVQGEDTEYVINNGDPLGEKTTVYPGGQPWVLPVAFFNSREQTLAVVAEFVQSGQAAAGFAWEDLYRLDWDAELIAND